MPAFFRKDRTGRDEFLSQLGHFNEEQRALFSRLCDMWEPEASYSKFLAKVGHEYLNAEATLNSMITQLENGRSGLIVKSVRDGTLEKDRIVLVDRDSLRFWYWLVENEWQECRVSDRKAFPTVKSLALTGGFPRDQLQPLSLTEISRGYIGSHLEDVILLALPDIEGKTLIVTPATLPVMVEVARLKIRSGLADSPIQPIVARLIGTVVSSLRKSLSGSEESFWNRLSEAIFAHREDLLAKRASIPNEFFIAAKILKTYTQNEMVEAERRRELEAEKRLTIQGILAQLSQKDDFLMSPDEFDTQFAPYLDTWPDLKELFVSHYMRPPGRTGLPAVVNIGVDYIFRDHLYPLFKAHHMNASGELREFYLTMLERIMRTNNKDRITAFSGIEAFREDVRERLTEEFPVLSDMLSKPRLVSEGIIHYGSKVLKIKDMNRIRNMLERYFESGSTRFKSPDKLFDLPPRILFDDAFRRMSWYRRFVMKLFGRYDSYVQALDSVKRKAGEEASLLSAGKTLRSEESVDSVRPYRARSISGESITSRAVRRRKETGLVRMKGYSSKQQEDAWDEFRTAFKKKKG